MNSTLHNLCLALIVAPLAGLGVSAPQDAQEAGRVVEVVELDANAVAVDDDEKTEDEQIGPDDQLQADERYAGGAPLKTDPDLMARLDKAEQYRADGNFRVASRLWQSVLAESGDILFTDDHETYFALTEKIESILAELPPHGLSAYRIAADAAAREILAQGNGDNDLDALSQVVKGYFMSSLGDDAAYRLGCIYLDRFDFVGAVRLLNKITDRYPDPSVPMDEVWLRIAIAYSYVGDQPSAREAMNKALAAGGDRQSRLYESVQELVEQSPQIDSDAAAASTWISRLGGVNRLGLMSALPAGYDSGPLRADWQFYFAPKDKYDRDDYLGSTFVSYQPDDILDSVGTTEEKLIKRWRETGWRPAGSMLFTDKYAIFRTGSDFTVWNRTGPLEADPAWRPIWLNHFSLDAGFLSRKQMYDAYSRYGSSENTRNSPVQPHEVQLFGDQISQAMSIHRGVLYSVEGESYNWSDSRAPRGNEQSGYSWGSIPRRTRTNNLAAYDLTTGKILWRIPEVELLDSELPQMDNEVPDPAFFPEDEETFEDVGFMAAPVGFGDLLLVPANVGGAIWIYALDSQNDGQLIWKSYLCDEPGGGSEPWSPIHLSIEGSTAYANCGTGVVFSFDPMTGGIRFARRYTRTGESNDMMKRFGTQMDLLELDGWKEDLVIPIGNTLIVMASDYNVVWAIDRQTGEFLWQTDNRPFGHKFEYLIGIHDDYIYLGGTDSVAAVSIRAEGRWEWVHEFSSGKSLGRGMVTPEALYVPFDNKILKMGLRGDGGAGDVIQEIPVNLGTQAPVGNLYSDGQRIWVAGGNRLYALGPDDGSIRATPGDDEEQENNSDESAEGEDEDDDKDATTAEDDDD
ncbi:MAG: PQQ-binding-like beta-propeller repeat protein [Pirellulaceae bacterium]